MCFHFLVTNSDYVFLAPGSLPPLPDSYQVEVEANIIDKGYTAQATIYYSYSSNAATVVLFSQGTDKRYIFSYNTDEIFTVSGQYKLLVQCI